MTLSVSVVIPTLDRKLFLIEAIESCLNQSHDLSQIIVVDNGSSDGTTDLMFPNKVILLEEVTKGAGFARNKGLTIANTSHVLFLDSDDLLTRTAIEALVEKAEKSQALVTYGRMVNFQKRNDEVLIGKSAQYPLASSTLIDVRAFEAYGQFEGDNFSFANWMIRLEKTLATFEKTEELVCYRRVHESNMGRSEESAQYYLNLIKEKIAVSKG
jgi:glycosyltransferase involved in cell wall biosynthesis